ncbi:hypothetical protein GSY69_12180 [Brevibacterium sp. 5221]|uniref:DUF112 domain-containing protein n=1 Tax=Brevibacterium rongguiense TaxID=2695267 RepID=A0A6N9HB29_9MICO|nr:MULTISPECIES: tripartite tricarboxylate transporter permease [Brevibacterium]MYM20694.1 hypothetical protein [Brevibacterium rongguiense]WAL39535.1 tripartite tricarboxylate transporter permease [Brevibacterium sp. BRM-1]
MAELVANIPIAVLMAVIGSLVFTLIGVVSGTDETATIAPLTLAVILLGVPPAGVFTFFLAGAISKHMTHAIPTMLLGIPGDTTAVPLLEEADQLRALGVPHLALRKAVAGALVSAVIAVPAAVLFAWILSPFGTLIETWAPWIFLLAAAGIAYASKAKFAGVLALIPFTALVLGLQAWTAGSGVKLATSYFLGIAIGPMIFDLLRVLVPANRTAMRRAEPSAVFLAPPVKAAVAQGGRRRRWASSPFALLDRRQVGAVAGTSVVSSATFVFSPVAMTVLMGELVRGRIKQGYERLTTVLTAKNGTTESTYIAEALIPLIAFGLPLSPVAAGPAAPLFNAPPVFSTDASTGAHTNLSSFLSQPEFLVFGLLSVAVSALIAYPFVMRFSHTAARFVVRHVSHEAIIAAFTALVIVVSLWEGGIMGLVVTLTIGVVSGALIRALKLHAGVLFMGYYVAVLSVPGIVKMLG